MPLKINIDAQKIAETFKELALEVEQDIQKAISGLAAMTKAKVDEMASQELHSSGQLLRDNLTYEQVSDTLWVVSIGDPALWIEEGLIAGKDMKPDLLKNASPNPKTGFRHKVIPFKHDKPATQMNQTAANIVSLLKQNLKKQAIPYKKIEKNSDGSPKLGKLHSFSFDSPIPGKGNTPALHRVNIYQSMGKSGNVRRDILTFRTVTDSPASQGKWIHPGYEGKHFLERAEQWALKTFEDQILPDILKKWSDLP